MLLFGIFHILLALIQPEVLELEITFVSEKNGGEIRLAWYGDQASFMEEALATASEKFEGKEVTIRIKVPNRPVAITSYHDLNSDQELSTNWMGIPNEPYGFSNNARGNFGPPSYEECVFDPNKTRKLTIYLK